MYSQDLKELCVLKVCVEGWERLWGVSSRYLIFFE